MRPLPHPSHGRVGHTVAGAGPAGLYAAALVDPGGVPLLYEERLGMPARAWGLLGLAVAATVVLVYPPLVVFTVASWVVSVVRFNGAVVRIDPGRIHVGRRSAPLAGLDLATLGRARNPWPWQVFSPRYLGANPIWARDSVGLRGSDEAGRPVRVAVGTSRRDELVRALAGAVPAARANAAAGPVAWLAAPAAGFPSADSTPGAQVAPRAPAGPAGWQAPARPAPPRANPPGWYPDPWAPVSALRWWDGTAWTGHVAVRTSYAGRSR